MVNARAGLPRQLHTLLGSAHQRGAGLASRFTHPRRFTGSRLWPVALKKPIDRSKECFRRFHVWEVTYALQLKKPGVWASRPPTCARSL